jgi:RecA/RadA recombinase
LSKEFFKKLVKQNTASAPLDESVLFNEKELTEISVLGINVAFSGDPFGGMGSGLHFFAAPSKHFKTIFGLIAVSAYLKKHPDGYCIFYDSEFGTTLSYWRGAGIDMSRVIHVPIANVEEFKFDIVNKLEAIKEQNIENIKKKLPKEKVCILIDSIGNLASKKELQDAIDEKSVADMSRAKALKGLFRMVTPYFTLQDIPCIAINHVYSEIGMFPKTIMGGGTGGTYSATNIFFISKSKETEKDENTKKDALSGFTFKIKIEKSRYVKEGSIIPITVNFKGGINKYTGLLDIGLELGVIEKPSNGRYKRLMFDKTTGEIIEDSKSWFKREITNSWFDELFANSNFREKLIEKYKLPESDIISDDELLTSISEESDDEVE